MATPPLDLDVQEPLEAPVVPSLDATREALLADAPPASSLELDSVGATLPKDEQEAALAQPESMGLVPQAQALDPQTFHNMQRALEAMYGDSFPLLKPGADADDWAKWAEDLWSRHSGAVSARLHLTRRNRLFRRGVQWISAIGFGPWREPPKPRDAARVVDNMIGPALDQRLQLITEQRPGFRTRPATSSPDDMKKAEAQQLALEYQYDQQSMEASIRELAYWAGTDGVSFGEVYWDADAGPWQELPVEGPEGTSASTPLGEARTRVRRLEQVRVSAEATATRAPWYWVIRDVLPKSRALRDYGMEALSGVEAARGDSFTEMGSGSVTRLGFVLPEEDELFRDQDLVDRFTVYCEKSEYLPEGLTLVVVGRKVVFHGPLICGVVPVFRFTDGSSDPSFYPTPIMEGWIDAQMRINAIKSKWVENVRYNAGPRIMAKENSISGETLVGGTMSVIGIKGLGGVQDNAKVVEGFSLAQDAKELLAIEKKAFEDLSGWNDTSRGSFSSDQSGRAILAIREQLERIFAPPIVAASQAMMEWAKITLAWMRWGYDLPRTVAVVGEGRPDLARELSSEDFDGVADVFIDPETLMPMPRALRLFLLQDMFTRGLLTPQEYRRRLPFGWIRSLSTPDEDQEARARRVTEAIRTTGNPLALPLLWVDDEAIGQDILQRELILPDDIDPMVRQAAIMRWDMLAQQAMLKLGGMPPQLSGIAGPGQPGQGGESSPPNAQDQPLLSTSPGFASAPVQELTSSEQQSAGRNFDAGAQR
ncbi:MAG: hypothetical protein L0Z53_06835 [Acidobacteriales bacterium]|nr:hypothetical protein [Terriglobales bacterium]